MVTPTASQTTSRPLGLPPRTAITWPLLTLPLHFSVSLSPSPAHQALTLSGRSSHGPLTSSPPEPLCMKASPPAAGLCSPSLKVHLKSHFHYETFPQTQGPHDNLVQRAWPRSQTQLDLHASSTSFLLSDLRETQLLRVFTFSPYNSTPTLWGCRENLKR